MTVIQYAFGPTSLVVRKNNWNKPFRKLAPSQELFAQNSGAKLRSGHCVVKRLNTPDALYLSAQKK